MVELDKNIEALVAAGYSDREILDMVTRVKKDIAAKQEAEKRKKAVASARGDVASAIINYIVALDPTLSSESVSNLTKQIMPMFDEIEKDFKNLAHLKSKLNETEVAKKCDKRVIKDDEALKAFLEAMNRHF